MCNVQREHVRLWDWVLQAKGSLTFADWHTAALDSSDVTQDAEEPISPVMQQRLAAAQLHAECVVAEFHALQERADVEQQRFNSKINKLQEAREEMQKVMEEQGKAMKVLEKELKETRTTGAEAQQAAQLKTTELEASSQVSKDLQEQLSQLTTEKDAMEQRLQGKTAEVVSLHDKATTSEQQTHDLKTKNSQLQQEVGHLQKCLADVMQLNCKMTLAQDNHFQNLNKQLVKLRQEKDASDRALQRKHSDFQRAQNVATAAVTSISEERTKSIELQQELRSLKDSLEEANTTKVNAVQAAKNRSSQLQLQLAQRDADLRYAKQQLVKLQKGSCDKCDEVATDRADELQEQLGRTTSDLSAAKEQITRLQMQLAGKRDEVTGDKQALAALHKAHHASVKVLENSSAQLQQQLAQKCTELSSAEESLASLQHELSQAQLCKYEATKDAQARPAQLLLLQGQLNRKVTDLGILHQKVTCLHADLGKLTKAKEDEMEELEGLKAELRAAVLDRDGAAQELTEMRNKMEGRAAKAQGRGQGPAARLAVTGPLVRSDRSNGPSSPAVPPDEPKGRRSAPTRLSRVPAPTSQDPIHHGSCNCGGVGGLSAPGEPDMPPGFNGLTAPGEPDMPPGFGALNAPGEPDMPPGFGGLDAPGEPDMPPGFGPVLSASTRKGRAPVRMPNLNEAFGDRLPSLRQMLPELVGLAEQLGKLHENGLVHQAVHQRFVLVGQQGDWKLARLEEAAPLNSSLHDSMVYEGIEAPEMAKEQLSAGYYYPNPMHDIWSFGLLLFFVLKGMGQLPHEHQTALQNGTTLLFANNLCDQGKYTTWRHKVEHTVQQGELDPALIKVVLGCLAKDPKQRFTAARVGASLTQFIHKKGW